MTRSLLLATESGLDDESGQNVDGEVFVFLVQRVPGIGCAEEKIEEESIGVSQGYSPSWKGRPRWWRERGGRGEHRRRRVHPASVRASRGWSRAVARKVVQGVCARRDRSSRQESKIYCHRAKLEREVTDLSDAPHRTRGAIGPRMDGE